MQSQPGRHTADHASFKLESLEQRQLLSGGGEPIHLDAGGTPESVVFADFNADRLSDTAVLTPGTGEVVVWSPDGAGGLGEWAVVEGEFAAAQRIQVLDVDADGRPDFGFFEADTHRFSTYRNNGDGTFTFAGGLQLADTATGLAFLYGNPGPAAEPVGPWIGPAGFEEDGEGFDGSGEGGEDGGEGDGGGDDLGDGPTFVGDPYIAVWHESLGAVEIVDPLAMLGGSMDGGMGDGSGEGEELFMPWPFEGGYVGLPGGLYFDTGSGGDALAVGDFNRDNQADLAVANRNDGTVSVIYNDEDAFDAMLDAGYDPAVDGLLGTETVVVGAEPVHINVFDVDGNGFMDLLVANAGDGTMSVAFGGESGFGAVESIPVAPRLTQVFINFNAFGRDLFVLGFSADGTITELDFTGSSLEVDKSEAGVLVANADARPRQIVVGEFTGDACIDVAAIDQAGEGVKVYVNMACEEGGDDHGEDDYEGPPIDGGNLPVPGVPDLLPGSDSGESDSDDVTAFNNAGAYKLGFSVKVGHVADQLADFRAKLVEFFDLHGPMFDKDGFEFTPTVWLNLYAGEVYVGTAEVLGGDETVLVETDGFTVLREGLHNIRAGFALGAPGLRGLLGTRSAALQIEVRIPRVEVDTSGGEEGETVTIRKDEEGNAILVLERTGDDGEEIEEINLGSFADLPTISGRVVTVRETKSGAGAGASRYAAGQSEDGLVLFVRTADGQWSGRNLTSEIDGSEPITESNIEVLTTPWGNVNMAGLNENGELVFYWQDGRLDDNGEFRWNYVNMADDQLRANGQNVPSFASSLESFVTPWGGMNVAGIDENGHLVVIWWAPGLDHWVSTDLTEHLGTTPLVGDVSAYVTPWGGINLLGLNGAGEMVAVWWAPGGEWTVSNLGEMLGAPTFVHGSLASFISERGDTFVAGISAAGDVGLFAWNVGDSTWSYQSFGQIDAELVGALTGFHSADDHRVTILAGSLEGDTYELVGDPFGEEPWDVGLFGESA
ncbi:MAG TPA: VCBS repeat-containing protein [Phycisphaerales bacterium]|nr:VCBS repeat-containing protein [Phycisphaerales bacterium]